MIFGALGQRRGQQRQGHILHYHIYKPDATPSCAYLALFLVGRIYLPRAARTFSADPSIPAASVALPGGAIVNTLSTTQ
jgi:hypothetical protein